MTRFVALLRGINVNGITIRMSELRAAFEGLGHTNVQTVLASGNVLFDSGQTDAIAIKAQIERALSDTFGYQAWIVLVDTDTLARVVRDFPFEADRAGWHPYVLFGSEPTVIDELVALSTPLDLAVEQVAAGAGVLYWQVLRSVGIGSPFSKVTGKTRYRSSTTTRNLRTLDKLLATRPTG